MMECKETKNLLYFYCEPTLAGTSAKGELEQAQRNSVEDHLKKCVHCKEVLADMKKTLSLVDKYKVEPAPDKEFFENYLVATRNRIESYGSGGSKFKFYLKPAFALAIIVIVFLGVKQMFVSKDKPEDKNMIADLEMIQDIDLYENMDLIENLDEIETK